MLGLYLHIPFCEKICDYCDFSAIQAPSKLYYEYVDLLAREMELFAGSHPGAFEKVETLYLGGGTPSILPVELLQRIFQTLGALGVPLSVLKEVSMEFNPESCTEEKVMTALELGVRRFSLGLQTFDSELLQRIGRSHSVSAGIQALERLLSLKNVRVSGDLMFDLPGQTLESFLQDIDRLSGYPLGHISFYGLTVSETTRLGVRIKKGELQINEDLYEPMYLKGVAALADKGFHRYEISNFAKLGEESLHNLNYWNRGEYLGFGPGAHQFFDGVRTYAPERYAKWREYVKNGAPRSLLTVDELGKDDVLTEWIWLSMRKSTGLELASLASMGAILPEKSYEPWLKKGFLSLEQGFLRLNGQGWVLMDSIVTDLLASLEA